MNRGELRSMVRDLTDLRMPELYPDAMIDAAVGEALSEVYSRFDWPFLRDTVTLHTEGYTQVYDLPSGVRSLEAVVAPERSRDRVLVRRSVPAVLRAESGLPERGRPVEYALDGGQLWLWPIPVSTEPLQLRHATTGVQLASDGDEPEFRDEYHVGVAYGAASLLLIREADNTERAEFYDRLFESSISRMYDDYIRDRDATPLVMGSRRAPQRRHRRAGGLR